MTIDFDKTFEDHVARYERHSDKLETLTWAKPKSSSYAIFYVRWCGVLMVWGDCYAATYRWYDTATLDWIATRTDLDYFIGKCTAAPHPNGLYSWSEKTARETIERVISEVEADKADREEEDEEDYVAPYDEDEEEMAIRHRFVFNDGWQSLGLEEEWLAWVNRYGHEVFGEDYYHDNRITEPGKTLTPCVRLHHEGLKRAMAQLRPSPEAQQTEQPAPAEAS